MSVFHWQVLQIGFKLQEEICLNIVVFSEHFILPLTGRMRTADAILRSEDYILCASCSAKPCTIRCRTGEKPDESWATPQKVLRSSFIMILILMISKISQICCLDVCEHKNIRNTSKTRHCRVFALGI